MPSLPGAGAAARAPAGPAPLPLPGMPGPPVAVGDAYLPYSQLFTADRLEAPFAGGLPAARGEWREAHFFSRALHREEAYLVWLPPGYGDGRATYPTLYLLHGVGGPDGAGVGEWLGYALTEDLDRMLALGLLEPMLVVLPAGEQGYWMNHADGGPRWADFVARDLVTHVDATFRTDPRRERRAVGGLSMGGHGALQLALNFPDVFGIAGAHSPTLRPFADSPEFFGDPAWFARYDPLSLIQRTDAARRIAFWIDVGADDAVARGRGGRGPGPGGQARPGHLHGAGRGARGLVLGGLPARVPPLLFAGLRDRRAAPAGAPAVAVQPLGPLLTSTGMAAAAAAPPLS